MGVGEPEQKAGAAPAGQAQGTGGEDTAIGQIYDKQALRFTGGGHQPGQEGFLKLGHAGPPCAGSRGR